MAFSARRLACAASIVTLSIVTAPAMAAVSAPSTAGDDVASENRALGAVASVLGRFRIDGTMNTLYDSNMLRVGDGIRLAPGTQKSDFRFSPGVTLSTALPFGLDF